MNSILLWIARGFGTGRIPVAPGTFGSLAGLLWFALLLLTGNAWMFAAGTVGGIAASVWLCGAGEKILRQKDPGSIVLDEICAIPVCFATWVVIVVRDTGSLPAPDHFVTSERWLWAVGVFAAFRLLDIAKPWPVRASQSLPGGWGVTIDDVLAAVYVNLATLAVYALA